MKAYKIPSYITAHHPIERECLRSIANAALRHFWPSGLSETLSARLGLAAEHRVSQSPGRRVDL